MPGGAVTEAGVRMNIGVALRYLDNWLRGIGAVAINNCVSWVNRFRGFGSSMPTDITILSDLKYVSKPPPTAPNGFAGL